MNDNGLNPEELAKVNWQKVGPKLFEAVLATLGDEAFFSLSLDTQSQVQEANVGVMGYLAPDDEL